MNRPSSVTILGQVYQIKYPKRIKGGLHGDTDTEKRLIRVREGKESDMEATLFHEMCHAVLFASGLTFLLDPQNDDALEETLIRALEHGLMPHIKLIIGEE